MCGVDDGVQSETAGSRPRLLRAVTRQRRRSPRVAGGRLPWASLRPRRSATTAAEAGAAWVALGEVAVWAGAWVEAGTASARASVPSVPPFPARPNPYLAGVVTSAPLGVGFRGVPWRGDFRKPQQKVARPAGLEPVTPGLEGAIGPFRADRYCVVPSRKTSPASPHSSVLTVGRADTTAPGGGLEPTCGWPYGRGGR